MRCKPRFQQPKNRGVNLHFAVVIRSQPKLLGKLPLLSSRQSLNFWKLFEDHEPTIPLISSFGNVRVFAARA